VREASTKEAAVTEGALIGALWPDKELNEGCGLDADFGERVREPLRLHVREQGRRQRRENRRELRRAFGRLGRRERVVIMQRFGLSGSRPQALEEIGHGLGVTREHVRLIESSALSRLRSLSRRSPRMRTAPVTRPNLRRGARGRGRPRSAARRRTTAARGSPGDLEPEPPLVARRSPRRFALPSFAGVAR
jgi:hypothetical protein